MRILVDDLHLFSLSGVCALAVVVLAIAAAGIRQWMREHEPKLVLRFAFAPRRPFLSLHPGSDRDLGDEQLFQWLRDGGATELMEKHPHFSVRWTWYRRAERAVSILVCLWLMAVLLNLVQGLVYAG